MEMRINFLMHKEYLIKVFAEKIINKYRGNTFTTLDMQIQNSSFVPDVMILIERSL